MGNSVMSRNTFRTACVLIFAVSLITTGCGRRANKQAQPKGPEVKVVAIKTERVVLTSELPGRTAASRVSEIRPQVSGLIIKRAFEEGSFVHEGDLLYQIDPVHYKAAYDQAKAAVSMAEANLPAVRSRVERYKELVTSHAIGQQEYDDAFAALRQAEGQLEFSKAALEIA